MSQQNISAQIVLNTYQHFLSRLARQYGASEQSAILSTLEQLSTDLPKLDSALFERCLDQAQTVAQGEENASTNAEKPLAAPLETIRIEPEAKPKNHHYFYKPQPLSIGAMMPTQEKLDMPQALRETWQAFERALEQIPTAHKDDVSLWLDHFDSCLQVHTQFIPSGVQAEVSFYDHVRTVVAMVTALYLYHQAQDSDDKAPLMLIQGDFFGIQSFIFANGGETRKKAAKILRARSFYVSLLMECGALKLSEALGLPSTSQLINAAGKFLIVAPNLPSTHQAINTVQAEFDQWFLERTYGQSGIGMASITAKLEDFSHKHYSGLMKQMFDAMDKAKFQRLNLTAADAPCVFENYLDQFNNEMGVCAIDGFSPAKVSEDGIDISLMAKDYIALGRYLTEFKRLIISRDYLKHQTLSTAIFGYYINFTHEQEITGKFGPLAREGKLARLYDFELPSAVESEVLWHGYARRAINAWVPRFDASQDTTERYNAEDRSIKNDEIKTFNHLACEDKRILSDNTLEGIAAISTVKGDVDNLGMIFQTGMKTQNFASYAALSRQMNNYFSLYLPYLCRTQFRNMYTVFAGGDDFFLIGPWHTGIRFAHAMQKTFKQFVAENPAIHFSTGISTTKPGLPIPTIAEMAEACLDNAKGHNPENKSMAPKNAVSVFGYCVNWKDFDALYQLSGSLTCNREKYQLSTGYIYGLLHLLDMAYPQNDADATSQNPQRMMWKSRLRYRTYRMLEQTYKHDSNKDEAIANAMTNLMEMIEIKGFEAFKSTFKVPLFINMYQRRR